MLLLILLRLLPFSRRCALRGATASAATLPLACALLLSALWRRDLRSAALLLLLRRTRTALTLPVARLSGLALLLSLLLLAGTLTLAAALAVARLLRLLLAALALARFAGALLVLAYLFLHEAHRLAGVLGAQLVVPAVRATLPSFRIGLLTGGAKNAFRERHRRNRRALYTSAVDETRRRMLTTLVQLAEENSPSACWDDRRAIELLRRDATRAELRELGVDEGLLEHIFAEEHAG